MNSFPDKLRLALRTLSLTATEAAAGVGVDKSVISRWLAGRVAPSETNLARLSAFIAERARGFRVLDWDRDVAGFEALLAEQSPGAPERTRTAAVTLDLPVLPKVREATARLGRAYEGFWRLLHPDDGDGFVYDYAWARMGETGLLRLTLAARNTLSEGWLLLLQNQVYMIVADAEAGGPGLSYAALSGVSHTKVEVMDGLLMSAGAEGPTARGVLAERIGDLSGDPDADARAFDAWRAAPSRPQAVPAALASHLRPDFGPSRAADGGERCLQMKRSRSLGRGAALSSAMAVRAAPVRPTAEAGAAPDRFADKLSLTLKALSLSGVQLASAAAVDKSVVNRWLAGSAEPSAYNLGRLTAVIAARAPGFSLLDWDRSTRSLAERLGVDLDSLSAAPLRTTGLALPSWDALLTEAMAHSDLYAGVFRAVRPSVRDNSLIEEYGLAEPRPGGVPRFRLANAWATVDGWLLALGGYVHIIAASAEHEAIVFGILHDIGEPRGDTSAGMIVTPSMDMNGSPTAIPHIAQRLADLSGEPAADERRFFEHVGLRAFVDPATLPPDLRARLSRDGGPIAYAQGGDMLLRMPTARPDGGA